MEPGFQCKPGLKWSNKQQPSMRRKRLLLEVCFFIKIKPHIHIRFMRRAQRWMIDEMAAYLSAWQNNPKQFLIFFKDSLIFSS